GVVLEDDAGWAGRVSAETSLPGATPPGAMPALVSLAACHTDAAPASGTSFAADLLAHGAAAVIGTETAVTDRYATRVFARVYTELARAATPDLVAALAQARRTVHEERAGRVTPRDQAIAGLEEWSPVTVLAAAGSVTLPAPAPAAPGRPGTEHTATRTFGGLLARDPGEFVGRRAEQHDLPTLLTTGDRPGVVLHGIGGTGPTAPARRTPPPHPRPRPRPHRGHPHRPAEHRRHPHRAHRRPAPAAAPGRAPRPDRAPRPGRRRRPEQRLAGPTRAPARAPPARGT